MSENKSGDLIQCTKCGTYRSKKISACFTCAASGKNKEPLKVAPRNESVTNGKTLFREG